MAQFALKKMTKKTTSICLPGQKEGNSGVHKLVTASQGKKKINGRKESKGET